MLKALEQWREKYGANILSEDGVIITYKELFKFFVDNGEELAKNYSLRGSAYCMGDTSMGIEDSSIQRIIHNFDNTIFFSRKSISDGHCLNNIVLKFNSYKDAHIVLWYSTCDWIDIHITPSKDDCSNGIFLCFPPRHIIKEEVK